MHADTLEQAIELQNAPAYGLTAGIHSLDAREIEYWLENVEAGNLYVNRGITGAIVRRQPFGGWKRSTVGTSAKAGGPNYLLTLGEFEPVFVEPKGSVVLSGVSERVTSLIEAAQPGMEFLEFDRVRTAARSDQKAWEAEFGVSRDVSAISAERNVFRYRALPITVRLSEGSSAAQLVRVLAAACRAGSPVAISSAVPITAGLVTLFRSDPSPLLVSETIIETDAEFASRVAGQVESHGDRDVEGADAQSDFEGLSNRSAPTRIRLIGGSALALADALGGTPDVAIYSAPVTTEGRIELLPFLREQAISITAHRFGNPDVTSGEVLPGVLVGLPASVADALPASDAANVPAPAGF